MANGDDGITLAIPERRPRALKDIAYNTLIYDTSNTSSGEDLSDIERIPSQDARRVLDVSLGPEQSRLTSPQTPAPEKAAKIEAAGGFFGDGVEDAERDITEEPDELEDEEESAPKTAVHTHDAIPVSRPHAAGQPVEWRQVEADAAKQELALGKRQDRLLRLMYGFLRPGERYRASSSGPTKLGSSSEMDCGSQEDYRQAQSPPLQAGEVHFLVCLTSR